MYTALQLCIPSLTDKADLVSFTVPRFCLSRIGVQSLKPRRGTDRIRIAAWKTAVHG